MAYLKVGDDAPDFSIKTSDANFVSLRDLKGKFIVLYFYPKDDTPGCTIQAMEFSELLHEFTKLNAIVLGVSKDDLKSHEKFKEKYKLNFDLGSDVDSDTCGKYSVLVEKSMFGKKYMGINRVTFLIDDNGKIAHIWPKVSVNGHATEVLQVLEQLLG